jgi:hypothetical protein
MQRRRATAPHRHNGIQTVPEDASAWLIAHWAGAEPHFLKIVALSIDSARSANVPLQSSDMEIFYVMENTIQNRNLLM